MKKYLHFLVLLPLALLCSKGGKDITGTATDTNSGSIAGVVLNDGKRYQNSVTVALYSGDTILTKRNAVAANPSKSIVTDTGGFRFDNLPAGTYSIQVTKDSLVVGRELGIVLSKNENKVINITINITINQTFNITNINNNQNVTINNFYFTGANGYLNSSANGQIVATFTKADTVNITMGITTAGKTDTITVVFVKQPDGTYISLPLETKLPVVVEDGPTIINTGNGSDSSTVKIDGRIREETR
jgi:hypothetical protein